MEAQEALKTRVAADQLFLLVCIFLALATAYVASHVWCQLAAVRKGNRIPGPRETLMGGNMGLLRREGGAAKFTSVLSSLHSLHGPVVRLWLGPPLGPLWGGGGRERGRLLVSVREAGMAKEALMGARDRPQAPGGGVEGEALNSMVFGSEAEGKLKRSFFDYHCHTTLMFKVHHLSTIVGERFSKEFMEKVEKKEEVDLRKLCRKMVTGILGASIYGELFLDSPLFTELSDLISEVANGQQTFWSSIIVPFWSTWYKKYKKDTARLKEVAEELLELGIRSVEESKNSKDSKDTKGKEQTPELLYAETNRRAALKEVSEEFIKAMLAEQTVLGEKLYSRETASRGAMSLMFHGCLTTSALLTRAFLYLAQYPGHQARVHMEIDAVCGSRSPPMEDASAQLHYLTAVVSEGARLAPVQPLLKRCSVDHDLRVGDYIIPAGAIIAIPTEDFQKESEIWGPEPEEFNPVRFLKRQTRNSEGVRVVTMAQSFTAAKKNAEGWRGAALTQGNPGPKLDTNGILGTESRGYDPRFGIEGGGRIRRNADCYAFVDPGAGPHFLLFGAGPRSCVGKQFALHLVRGILATIFQKFAVEFSPGSDPDPTLTIEELMLNFSPSPSLIFIPRR